MTSSTTPLREVDNPAATDPAWALLQRPVGPSATVAGVDTNGVHSFDVHTTGGASVTIPHDRTAGQTPGDVSDGWAASAQPLLLTTLANVVTAVDSDANGTVFLTPKHEDGRQADPFVLDNFVVQGGATIATLPTGEFPVTGVTPHDKGNAVQITFRMVDAVGATLGGSSTHADIDVILNDTRTNEVAVLQRNPAHALTEPIRCLVPPGSKFAVRWSSEVSQPPLTLSKVLITWTTITL